MQKRVKNAEAVQFVSRSDREALRFFIGAPQQQQQQQQQHSTRVVTIQRLSI